MKGTKIFLTTLVIFLLPFIVKSQSLNHDAILDNLCQKWVVDSIEVNDMQKKFPPPENIMHNYTEFRKDGTFQGQDFSVVLNGKWKMDFEKMQIIHYDIDNELIEGEIIFNIIELTENHLAITSKQMSGNQVTMHYRPATD